MTTITPTMLASMRHAAENEPDADSAVRAILALVPGVTIADTEEQTMSKMTITQEQFEAVCSTFMDTNAEWRPSMKVALESLGITIARPKQPEAMEKLAREIAESVKPDDGYERAVAIKAARAALQHADAALDNPALRGLSFDAAKPMLKTALGAA